MGDTLDTIGQELDLARRKGLRTALCLSTTANLNNPPIYVGRIRNEADLVAGVVVLADKDRIAPVVQAFDGRVDVFFLDCEWKNTIRDLVGQARQHIHLSASLVFKPNDFTVMALDMWLSLLRETWSGARVAVAGAGNIGGKIALNLAERGANVQLWRRDIDACTSLAAGLRQLARGTGSVDPANSLIEAVQGADLLLGCTPGVPVIDGAVVCSLATGAILIDVGNGTLHPGALDAAVACGLRCYCLTPDAGFAGFAACWVKAQDQLSAMCSQEHKSGARLLTPGYLGRLGDILVKSCIPPYEVIGVCDGQGSLLSSDQTLKYIRRIL